MNAPARALAAWPVQALQETLAPLLPGVTVEVLPSIDSSNAELMRRARQGLTAPVLLVAEEQTAGRGRQGRPWHGRPGDALTFSLGLPFSPTAAHGWSGLSLVAGIALAESLHPALRLKWPNDLWLPHAGGWGKAGGILVETVHQGARNYAVAGIGLNIVPPPTAASQSPPPCGLRALVPAFDAAQALTQAAPPLARALRAFEAHGFAPFTARFAARDLLAGQAVRLSDGTEGTARGVDATGALLVHTADGMKQVTSSEVSVRPAATLPMH